MYKSITTAVAVLALASAGAAFAQTTTNSSNSQHMGKTAWHAKHMQSQLAKLKAQLKITSAQEPAWNGFAQAAENMRPSMNSKMKRQAANLTAPEIFDGMAKRAQQRAQKAEALAKAADHLYGTLSSEQKATWNKAMAEMHAKMHRRWQKHRDTMHHSTQGMHGSVGGRG